ncbi:hypothetical protein L917_02350 [Phytophthora nicotianae]|uniref:Uncharacterized protein n=1 Tax=Phytophthora nicotianae TaxID=4792 RepID=W2LWF1_PHYNI|nr:hypothetical protein L917_02350 [Phytophthora nicotianae]
MIFKLTRLNSKRSFNCSSVTSRPRQLRTTTT